MNPAANMEMDEEAQRLIVVQNKATDNTEVVETFKVSRKITVDFIRKVYGILLTQLTLTFGWTVFVINNQKAGAFVQANPFLVGLAAIVSVATLYLLICFIDFQRRVPGNYIALFSFTACEAYIVGYLCLPVEPRVVYTAGVMTLALCAALTLYAFTTKTDFTMRGGMLFVALVVFVVAGIMVAAFDMPLIRAAYHVVGVLLFGFYLVYDTQLILQNKSLSFTTSDYIAAALNIYIDIINVFLEILQLVDRR